jgi:hypothetical protein
MSAVDELLEKIINLSEKEQRALLDHLLRKFGYPDPRTFLPWDDLDDEEVDRAYAELAGEA